ncbi:MAG: DUF938 domain-containing protein [Oceanospirillales bacterium]|nr:MAG: DUF938 domain-containing protein [Oceanospirillales bacterium]
MITIDLRLYAPAATRNREPILSVLNDHLPNPANVLEIASGTGEHATYLSEHLEQVRLWQPTEIEPSSLKSIEAWREHYEENERVATKVARSKYLDVTAKDPHIDHAYNVIVVINLLHITPWTITEALMRFAQHHLPLGGLLYLYGPFWQQGETPADSNVHFDSTLKKQNSAWGIRDLDAVLEEGHKHGLSKKAVISMPANNLSVIFECKNPI